MQKTFCPVHRRRAAAAVERREEVNGKESSILVLRRTLSLCSSYASPML